MALDFAGFHESPEERELRRRQATARRIKILLGVTILAIAARFLIKDPPPPRAPDTAKDTVRIVPGMLDNLTATDRAKIDPQLLARVERQEREQRIAKLAGPTPPPTAYKPTEPPVDQQVADKEIRRQEDYAYAKRRQLEDEARAEMERREQKPTTVVVFRGNRYLQVEKSLRDAGTVELRLNRGMIARVPDRDVVSVIENAVDWQEPVPAGQVRLKPAKGITITVSKDVGRRITVRRSATDEI